MTHKSREGYLEIDILNILFPKRKFQSNYIFTEANSVGYHVLTKLNNLLKMYKHARSILRFGGF